MAFTGVKIRDAAAIYPRVDVNKQQVENLKVLGKHYFTANCILLSGVNPISHCPPVGETWVWTWPKLNAELRGQAHHTGKVY